MRFLKFLALTLVVALGFSSCKPNGGDDHDHTSDLAGTWTCLTENYAEALIINEDGSAVSYGVENGEYWENVRGTVVTNGDNNITMTFEDNDNLTGHFDIIPGKSFSLFEDSGERYIYQYCENDLADEIVGMWVSNDTPNAQKNDMAIISYFENGVSTFTGMIPNAESYMVTTNSSYNVVGDLSFQKSAAEEDTMLYLASRLVYTPNGTSFGDIMTKKMYITVENTRVETTMTYLRIKQTLDLANKNYDYNNLYVSNVKGEDKDIEFLGQTFNFSKMNGELLDKMLKTLLFSVEFPNANTIKYSCHYNTQAEPAVVEAPITVDGNKMTIKLSEMEDYSVLGLKDVDIYTFQDQDNTQMHMYMPTHSFEAFFGNMRVLMLSQLGQLDTTDAAAVKDIYDRVDAAVESINLSIILK